MEQKFPEHITKLADNTYSKFDGLAQIGISLIPVLVYAQMFNASINMTVQQGQYVEPIPRKYSGIVLPILLISITIFSIGLYSITTNKIFRGLNPIVSFVVFCVFFVLSFFIYPMIGGFTVSVSITPVFAIVLIIILQYLVRVSIGVRNDLNLQYGANNDAK